MPAGPGSHGASLRGEVVPGASRLQEAQISDLKLADEAAGVLRLLIRAPTPEVVTAGLMAGLTYYHVAIPLLGYHWPDFGVNGDEAARLAMWDRSWHATMTVAGTVQGAQPPLIVGASVQQSPFRVP